MAGQKSKTRKTIRANFADPAVRKGGSLAIKPKGEFMKAGVSTASLYPLETEKSVKVLAQLGVKAMEVFLNSTLESEGEYLDEMLRLKAEYGLDIVSLHPFSSPMETVFLFSRYERRVREMLTLYARYFEAMNKLGAKIFVLHGALASADCPNEFYFEQYGRLFELGKNHGVIVAQENISYCKSKNPSFIAEMKRILGGECAFVLDIKQALRSGVSPFELIKIMGKNLAHVHISDSGALGDCLPLGKGDFDFAALYRALVSEGFDGAVLVELYRSGYGEYRELFDSMKSFEKIISKYNVRQNA